MKIYALILAGGYGTRLWPLSRQSTPKQLLRLLSDSTLLQMTAKRIEPIISPEDIFVVASNDFALLVRQQLPELRPANLIIEPMGKGTASCIALGALHMSRRDRQSIMISLNADHFILDEETFRQALLAAAELASKDYLVTLGIKPDYPEIGYGYIQRAERLGEFNNHQGYRVARFLEKPNLTTAEELVKSGDYYWNSGIFIWKIEVLLRAYEMHMPEMHVRLMEIEQYLDCPEAMKDIWEEIIPQSVDVAIMEKAERVAVVPISVGWSDVGSWSVIHQLKEKDGLGNVIANVEHIGIDTTNTLILGNGRLVATIGLNNIIIIGSDDALLVCSKERAQDVKLIVDALKARGRLDLL